MRENSVSKNPEGKGTPQDIGGWGQPGWRLIIGSFDRREVEGHMVRRSERVWLILQTGNGACRVDEFQARQPELCNVVHVQHVAMRHIRTSEASRRRIRSSVHRQHKKIDQERLRHSYAHGQREGKQAHVGVRGVTSAALRLLACARCQQARCLCLSVPSTLDSDSTCNLMNISLTPSAGGAKYAAAGCTAHAPNSSSSSRPGAKSTAVRRSVRANMPMGRG